MTTTEDGLQPCPCCDCKTLGERGGYEICEVCGWEDDGQDNDNADEVLGGPNGDLSLTQARANYRQFGSSSRQRSARMGSLKWDPL